MGGTPFPTGCCTLGWGWGLPRMGCVTQVGLQCLHCQPLQTGTPGVQTGSRFQPLGWPGWSPSSLWTIGSEQKFRLMCWSEASSLSVLRLKLKCLAPFMDSIYVFHLGISIFLCPGLISLLWTGLEGEDSFQLPVMDGSCISHQQQGQAQCPCCTAHNNKVNQQRNALGFLKVH